MTAPLVVTLAIDDGAQARFDAERSALFPAGRTAVGAHVTLFHAVPGSLLDDVTVDLVEACDRPGFAVSVDEVMPLGRGVAYRIGSDELTAVHRELQRRWWGHLTDQDRQGFRPHVTVQNKVTVERARRTLAELRARFVPFTFDATGLRLWRYDGGPWTALADYPFA